MKSVLTLLAIAAVGLPVTSLSAEDGPRKGKEGHGSKALTLEDITSSERYKRPVESGMTVDVAAIFAAADANNDGTLTKEEMPAFHKAMQSAHREQMFTRIDTDGSGELTADELKAFREAMKERREARKEERGDDGKGQYKRGEKGEGEEKAERPSPAERFASADADGSGGLSLDEFMSMEHKHRGPKGHGHKNGPKGKHKGKQHGEGAVDAGDG